jgi:phosphate-selective porin OprO/OprP
MKGPLRYLGLLGMGVALAFSGHRAWADDTEELSTLKATVTAQGALIKDQAEAIAELKKELSAVKGQPAAALTEEEVTSLVTKTIEEKQAAAPAKPEDFRFYWNDGLRADSTDGRFKFKFGGRLHYDAGWVGADDLEEDLGTDLKDGAEVRRARLYFDGVLYDTTEFKLEYDFAGGSAAAKDVFLRFLKLPAVGTLTLGHFKEPFSLEEQTSDNYVTFIERSLPNIFAPSYDLGAMANNALLDQRMTWAVGVFRVTDDNGGISSDDGGYAATARVTGLPYYEEDGAKLVHLGAGYSIQEPADDTIRIRQRPEAHFVNERLTDTKNLDANDVNLLNGELASVFGPLSVQAEYFATGVSPGAEDGSWFDGLYAQVSYFLTGEHRPYKKSEGVFDRVKPKKNFRQDGGVGAWEVAMRYSLLDLTGEDLPDEATRMQDLTAGLNWYLNPNVRLMWNYIHSCVEDDTIDGSADIALMRFQVDF